MCCPADQAKVESMFKFIGIMNEFFITPATKLGQGYVFTGVSDSVHRGGGSASVHAGIPPPPGADPPRSRHPPEQTPPTAEHAGRYSQRAGSTHPTGMQSCWKIDDHYKRIELI